MGISVSVETFDTDAVIAYCMGCGKEYPLEMYGMHDDTLTCCDLPYITRGSISVEFDRIHSLGWCYSSFDEVLDFVPGLSDALHDCGKCYEDDCPGHASGAQILDALQRVPGINRMIKDPQEGDNSMEYRMRDLHALAMLAMKMNRKVWCA